MQITMKIPGLKPLSFVGEVTQKLHDSNTLTISANFNLLQLEEWESVAKQLKNVKFTLITESDFYYGCSVTNISVLFMTGKSELVVQFDKRSISAGRGGILMPKMQNRFRVLFDGFAGLTELVEMTQQVVSCSKPHIKWHSISSFWEPIEIKLRDDVLSNVLKLAIAQIKKQLNDDQYKFKVTIEVLDGDNKILEEWKCQDCLLQGCDFGQLYYGSGDPVEISLTIQPDKVIMPC